MAPMWLIHRGLLAVAAVVACTTPDVAAFCTSPAKVCLQAQSPFKSAAAGSSSLRSAGERRGTIGLSAMAGEKPRIKERLRRLRAFATDVVASPLRERFFRRWGKKFVCDGGTADDRAQRQSQVALVTGASGGIGKQVSMGLAARGYTVVMACRDTRKGEQAAQEVREQVPGAEVAVVALDLSSLESVRELSRELHRQKRRVSVLVNNAGYGGGGRGGLTGDGLEHYFQVNHLGHFLLTHLLLPGIKATGGRVISVSSVMHWGAYETFDKDPAKRSALLTTATGGGGEYRRSKLYNLLFTYGLARRFSSGEGGLSAHAVNPGFVCSDIWRHKSERTKGIYQMYAKTPFQGAEGIIRAATDGVYGNQSGYYLVDSVPRESSKLSYDEEAADWLWSVSEGLAGVVNFGEPEPIAVDQLEALIRGDGEGDGDGMEDAEESEEERERREKEEAAALEDALRREREAVGGMQDVADDASVRLQELAKRAAERLDGL